MITIRLVLLMNAILLFFGMSKAQSEFCTVYEMGSDLPIPAARNAGIVCGIDPQKKDVTITVLVLYTKNAEIGLLGMGYSNFKSAIEKSFEEANSTMTNSETGVRFQIAHMSMVDIPNEKTYSMSQLRALIHTTTIPSLKHIPEMRAKYQADLVTLVGYGASGCGSANLHVLAANFHPAYSNQAAFSSVHYKCLENKTLIHELGHNLGLRHAHGNFLGANGSCQNAPAACNYFYGHHNQSAGQRTIMALPVWCSGYSCNSCTRVGYFSDQFKYYMPSNSVDVSSRSSAYAMGSDIAQAARAIRLTAPIVAQYGEFLAAMPVEIISFEVTEVTGHHKIYWKTTSEVNLDFYQVQYSHNLKDWATIETMEATGSFDGVTSYESVHKPFQRSNFYRIRGVDFNGDEHLSEIKSMTDEATPLTIFPNPTDGEVTIISNQVVEKLEIYDITGQRMLIPPVFSKDGAVTVSVATFLPGTYIIEAYCSAAIIRDRLLIK